MQAEPCYTVDEVREQILRLTNADWCRLVAISRHFSRGIRKEPGDLLQEAFVRVLAGRRRCPKRFSLISIMARAMESISRDDKRDEKRHLTTPLEGYAEKPLSGFRTDEDVQISCLDSKNSLNEIALLCRDDPLLMTYYDGICLGLRGKELEEHIGVDTKGLDALRKRFERLKAKVAGAL